MIINIFAFNKQYTIIKLINVSFNYFTISNWLSGFPCYFSYCLISMHLEMCYWSHRTMQLSPLSYTIYDTGFITFKLSKDNFHVEKKWCCYNVYLWYNVITGNGFPFLNYIVSVVLCQLESCGVSIENYSRQYNKEQNWISNSPWVCRKPKVDPDWVCDFDLAPNQL